MNTDRSATLIARLAELDPAADVQVDEDQRAVASATLHRVLRQDPHDTHPAVHVLERARRRLVARRVAVIAVAGAVGLVGATAATGVTPSGLTTGVRALAASTPPMLEYGDASGSAEAQLLEVAAAAAANGADAVDGEYRYLHWQAWTYRGGDGEADRIVPVERWAWLAEDGTARTLGVEDGRSKGYLDWPVGGYVRPAAERLTLPADADGVAGALTGSPTARDADAYQLLDRYTQLAQIEGLGAEPGDRAGLLRALATSDVVAYGEVTDRAGRTGQAFGASWRHDGLRDEIRVVIDPTTGRLLAKESILHGPWLLGSTETVTDYVVYLENTWATSLPDCGDLGCTTMPPAG